MVGWWFSQSTLVSSTNKSDHHYIAEIFFKVTLNTIALTSTRVLLEKHFYIIIDFDIKISILSFFLSVQKVEFVTASWLKILQYTVILELSITTIQFFIE
jgi:hypothetical protein